MLRLSRMICMTAVFIVFSGVSNYTEAGLVSYYDRAVWEAATLGVVSTEDFTSVSGDVNFLNTSKTVGVLTLGSIYPTVDIYSSTIVKHTGNYVSITGMRDDDFVTVGLPSGASAFGFDYKPVDRSGDKIRVSRGGVIIADLTNDARLIAGRFYGVIDTGRSNTDMFKLSATPGGDGMWARIENISWDTAAVPEPTTIALLGIGLVGMAGAEARRRRKKKTVDNS